MDYKDSGVDVNKSEALVDWLKNSLKASKRNLSPIGGYASIYEFPFKDFKNPCLVSSVDGVGTKLKWAIEASKEESVAQDLVAMSVNDLLCVGATPLFFLDYYACSYLDSKQAESFLKGVKKACEKAGCELVGGETAEMPGFYQKKDFDCCGFALGVVEKEDILPQKEKVKKDDILIGIESSGAHSNGYSLLRKLFSDQKDIETLLKPTFIYTDVILDLIKNHPVKAMAHITGGGLDNLLRVVPEKTQLEIDKWSFPEIFAKIQQKSNLDDYEMLKTFNCGVGMVLIVSPENVDEVQKRISKHSYKSFVVGKVKKEDKESLWYIK